MTIKQALSTKILDADVLLAHLLGVDRAYLYAHPEAEIRRTDAMRFRTWLRRRARHEPVAYIVGEKQFYGLTLKVNRHTLIPRPETELLVETVLSIIANVRNVGAVFRPPSIEGALMPAPTLRRLKILDIGTGSGAIAIVIAKNLHYHTTKHGSVVVATDTSARALAVARANARRHGVHRQIKFVKADLLPPRGRFDVVVANLPYLTTAEWKKCPPDVRRYEPRTALDGGKDGLDVYRRLLDQLHLCHSRASGNPCKNSDWIPGQAGDDTMNLIFEIGPTQSKKITALIKKHFPRARIQVKKDLSGCNRVVIAIL